MTSVLQCGHLAGADPQGARRRGEHVQPDQEHHGPLRGGALRLGRRHGRAVHAASAAVSAGPFTTLGLGDNGIEMWKKQL